MPINPYFNILGEYAVNDEVDLLRGFTREAIQISGFDTYYIVRSSVKLDTFFGEDVLSNFTTNYNIEGFLENLGQAWGGLGDVIMDMGTVVTDQAILHYARDRFQEITGMTYPMEGDLVFFPGMFNKGLWEIKFVEDESPMYELGQRLSFKLKMNLFDLSGESFTTGITDLDTRMGQIAPVNLETLEDLTDLLKADNEQIDNESKEIVDDSETNPWGEFGND